MGVGAIKADFGGAPAEASTTLVAGWYELLPLRYNGPSSNT